jgi:uncharacterized membrane protein
MKNEKRSPFIMRKLVGYFLQGLLFAAPIGLTGYVIFFAFQTIDGILSPIEDHFKFYIPGLGILAMIISITILGIVGQTVVAQPFKVILERVISKAPFLKMVYSSIRDFMEAFVGKEKKFNQPVSVIVNQNPEIERFGFITQHDLSELNIQNKVAVYFPFSYSFTGELLIVPVECVKTLDIPAGELMKFIVSGGVTRV